MTKVYLNRKINQRIALGHPWIYNNEVDRIAGPVEQGDIVEVYYFDGQLAGRGYINPESQIIIRLLTRKREDITAAFFHQKIQTAWDYRKHLGYTENCRLVFGEADGLPALIIDKFNDYFVMQTLSYGMEVWKDAIVAALKTIFNPKGIYERNDVPVRELEGLAQQKGFLTDPFPTEIIINENDLQFYVNIETGQKTGYFLDQQDNRRAIKNIVKGADVLGAFTYTGTFEIHAAHYGAKSVFGIDISESAVAQANKNAALNKLDHIVKFEAMNAFDVLKNWGKQGKKYDVVMLDPPAFTKSRNNIDKAITGYKEINLRGMQLIRNGGFLVSSSCTNLVSPELFLETIEMAAHDAKKRIRQVTYQSQSSDHPIIWGMENTHYLKFLIVEVCDK
jgi:23S rRNA (cytosine1962-C5)-methyltransferase